MSEKCTILHVSLSSLLSRCTKLQKDTAYSLTLQIFTAGHWHDAMRLEFPEPQRGFVGPCRFHYRQDYLADHLEEIQQPFATRPVPGSRWIGTLRCSSQPRFCTILRQPAQPSAFDAASWS